MGGLLAMPAVFFWATSDTKIVMALVRHGALIEMGWEMGDTIKKFYTRLFDPEGAVKVPNILIIMVIVMHHTLSCCMVVPMNMYYPELYEYAEIIFVM